LSDEEMGVRMEPTVVHTEGVVSRKSRRKAIRERWMRLHN
jgi:hypothetical protein